MLKRTILFILIVISFSARSQSFNYGIITNVNQRGQVGKETCWAASIEMLRSCYLANPDSSNYQMEVINEHLDTNFSYARFDISKTNEIPDIAFNKLLDTLKGQFESFNINANVDSIDSGINLIQDFPCWDTIKSNFTQDFKSPILLWRWVNDSDFRHVMLVIGYHESILQDVKNGDKIKAVRELLVYDPYNKVSDAEGFRLSINYDQFKEKVSCQKARGHQPDWAFIHHFKPKRSELKEDHISLLSSVDTITSSSEVYTRKKCFLQSKKRAQLKLTSQLAPLYFIKTDTTFLPKFWNIKDASKSNNSNTVTVKYIRKKDLEHLNYRSFKSFKPTGQEYFNSIESDTTHFVYVTSKYPNQKKKIFIQNRIEPYDQSIIAVLSDLQSQSNESQTAANNSPPSTQGFSSSFVQSSSEVASQNSIRALNLTQPFNKRNVPDLSDLRANLKTVFYFKTYSDKPDLLLLQELGKKNSILLIDLYSKLSDTIGQKLKGVTPVFGNFNYSVFRLTQQQLQNLAQSL